MPNPAEMKTACENHYGPERSRIEREKREQAQIAERIALEDQRPKKTYEQLQAECAEKGLFIGKGKAKPQVFDVDAFCQAHGCTKADWDKIPSKGEYEEMLRKQGYSV